MLQTLSVLFLSGISKSVVVRIKLVQIVLENSRESVLLNHKAEKFSFVVIDHISDFLLEWQRLEILKLGFPDVE